MVRRGSVTSAAPRISCPFRAFDENLWRPVSTAQSIGSSNVSSNGCVEKQMRLHVRCVSRVLAEFYARRASLAQRPPRNLRRDATPHWHVRCWSLVLVFLQRVRFCGHQAARPYNRLGSRASHALGIIFRRGSCRHHWLARYVGTDGPRRDDPHKTISGWALRAGVPGDVFSGIRNKREASATERDRRQGRWLQGH